VLKMLIKREHQTMDSQTNDAVIPDSKDAKK
jgi:hypothetical protein